jgi:hypothetical protein
LFDAVINAVIFQYSIEIIEFSYKFGRPTLVTRNGFDFQYSIEIIVPVYAPDLAYLVVILSIFY